MTSTPPVLGLMRIVRRAPSTNCVILPSWAPVISIAVVADAVPPLLSDTVTITMTASAGVVYVCVTDPPVAISPSPKSQV